MHIRKRNASRLFRPASLFLPASLAIASLLGRGSPALGLFITLYAVKLCALCSSDALRAAFSVQPSMKYVQGSALLTLFFQLPGALLAALLMHLIPAIRHLLPLLPCGLFLNLEQVFYEYLYATGDASSATLCRCITAALTLVGLLLCAPPSQSLAGLTSPEIPWLPVTTGLSALVGLVISLALGGKLHPTPNAEVLRHAPVALAHSFLYPALAFLALFLLWPASFTPFPLFAGLALYEACRTPFRRTAPESVPMNRLLAIIGVASLLVGIPSRLVFPGAAADAVAMTCLALLIAALCAFALYGRVQGAKEKN